MAEQKDGCQDVTIRTLSKVTMREICIIREIEKSTNANVIFRAMKDYVKNRYPELVNLVNLDKPRTGK